MTQTNADVEFIRRLAQRPPYCDVLLAHIDQLEADLREARNEWESARERAESANALLDEVTGARNGLVSIVACKEEKIAELEQAAIGRRSSVMPMWTETVSYEPSRPTVHEIAAQIFAGWVRITGRPSDELLAASAYKAAEALVAEGRRRDGQG